MPEPQIVACNRNAPEGSGSLDRLVRLCVANHTPEELALGWLRYECVRKLNARAFAELCKRNISGENFDNMVTSAIADWKLVNEPNAEICDGTSRRKPSNADKP